MRPWLYLFLASVCEICWLYCIRQLNGFDPRTIMSGEIFMTSEGLVNLAAIAGYAGFGICNVLLFSMALKKIHASMAFAVWTGVALAGTTLIDAFWLSLDFTAEQGIFTSLIVIGVIGLRFVSAKAS